MNAPKRPSLPDATELLRQMREGERSAVDIVDEHLRRIERLHPTLNAAIEVMADEARRKAQKPRKGPLSGLPVTVKETFALKGHQITAGSLRMPPVECHADAPVVARLRRAGAIIIARSNVPEFVMTPETNNLRWGRTNNPLDPERVAGGSTGGEGALVGSGCSPAGLGTDSPRYRISHAREVQARTVTAVRRGDTRGVADVGSEAGAAAVRSWAAVCVAVGAAATLPGASAEVDVVEVRGVGHLVGVLA